jgi:hypothetical protein
MLFAERCAQTCQSAARCWEWRLTHAGSATRGLHYIVEGARRGERGLIVGFHETPDRLIGKAEAIGLDLGRHVAEGRVEIRWHGGPELLAEVVLTGVARWIGADAPDAGQRGVRA